MRLTEGFYSMPAESAAFELLGKTLCRRTDDGVIRRVITETECYCGEQDSACHAHRGRTTRTEIMYLPGGYAYIYLCYGIHSLLNVVTGKMDHPEAVLIRAVDGYIGPGKLTKAMHIDRSLNGENLTTSEEIWIEDDGWAVTDYEQTPRIGIDYAEKADRERLWRYVLKDMKRLSFGEKK